MGQCIKAFDKLAHDAENAPGISNGKVEVHTPIKGMFFDFNLFNRCGLRWLNKWLRWAMKQPLVFGDMSISFWAKACHWFLVFPLIVVVAVIMINVITTHALRSLSLVFVYRSPDILRWWCQAEVMSAK